ncbi:MAG: outer membrane beta-barrel protein [Bacteroidota bacterium]
MEATPAAVAVVPVVAPASTTPPWNTVMKEELLVDSYYMYNFSGANSLTPPALRAYDTQSNSFTVNYAKVGLQVDSDPVSVRADIGFGALAALLGGSSGPYSVAIQQAFASLKLPGTPLTVDFGRFNTTAGAEVIEANRNWLYSRSMLFYIIPVHHTGVRATLKINDMVSIQGTLANGIFNDMPDNNSTKTGGLSLSIAPLPTTSIVLTGYFGKEGAQGMTGDVRTTIDLVVGHNVSDALGLNLNVDYVKLGEANAVGAAAMGRFVAAEHLTLALRGEFIKDKGIFSGAETSVYEGTACAAFPFANHLEVRAELRGDFAADPIFNQGTTEVPDVKKNQFTGTVAFLGYIQ